MLNILLLLVTTIIPGEKLNYQIKYGPISIGTLELQTKENILWQGKSCYHFTAHLKSNPKYRKVFSIDDRLDSYVRISDFATLKAEKKIKERNYQAESRVIFDYEQKRTLYSDSSTYPLYQGVKDLLTTWYYYRIVDLKVGNSFSTPVHIDKKNYQMEFAIDEVRTIKFNNVRYYFVVFEPTTKPKTNLGNVYLSIDEKRLPVIIKNKNFFGELVATLKGVE